MARSAYQQFSITLHDFIQRNNFLHLPFLDSLQYSCIVDCSVKSSALRSGHTFSTSYILKIFIHLILPQEQKYFSQASNYFFKYDTMYYEYFVN